MAIQIDRPRRPMNVILRSMAREAMQQMQADFRTQHIYPYEIYPGFKRVNEQRKRNKSWHATGEGIKSFQYEVMDSSTGNISLRFEYLSHLDFANLGIVPGTKLEDVQRGRKARYNKRYVAIWDNRDGETHRPSIMREMRHTQHKLENYLQDFYGEEILTTVYKTFSGMHAIDLTV